MYEEESYKIRGACFAVYDSLGGGIKEKIIENALIKELINAGLRASPQKRIDVKYKRENVGTYIPDVVVEDKISAN